MKHQKDDEPAIKVQDNNEGRKASAERRGPGMVRRSTKKEGVAMYWRTSAVLEWCGAEHATPTDAPNTNTHTHTKQSQVYDL